jgi:hypothetical protein
VTAPTAAATCASPPRFGRYTNWTATRAAICSTAAGSTRSNSSRPASSVAGRDAEPGGVEHVEAAGQPGREAADERVARPDRARAGVPSGATVVRDGDALIGPYDPHELVVGPAARSRAALVAAEDDPARG